MKTENMIIIGAVAMGVGAILFIPENGENNISKMMKNTNAKMKYYDSTLRVSDERKSWNQCFDSINDTRIHYGDLHINAKICAKEVQVNKHLNGKYCSKYVKLRQVKFEDFKCTEKEFNDPNTKGPKTVDKIVEYIEKIGEYYKVIKQYEN